MITVNGCACRYMHDMLKYFHLTYLCCHCVITVINLSHYGILTCHYFNFSFNVFAFHLALYLPFVCNVIKNGGVFWGKGINANGPYGVILVKLNL